MFRLTKFARKEKGTPRPDGVIRQETVVLVDFAKELPFGTVIVNLILSDRASDAELLEESLALVRQAVEKAHADLQQSPQGLL